MRHIVWIFIREYHKIVVLWYSSVIGSRITSGVAIVLEVINQSAIGIIRCVYCLKAPCSWFKAVYPSSQN